MTGANRGLGPAAAPALADRGLHVVPTGRSRADAEAFADDSLPSSADQFDVTEPASVVRAFANTIKRYGRLDVLVNDAGIAADRGQAASNMDGCLREF